MELAQLQRHYSEFTATLFREGFLDEQFSQVQQLQDETNPDFVFEVVTLFIQDSERLLGELARALEAQPVDFKKVDAHVHQLKGSSASIGAHRVKNACLSFRSSCDGTNLEGCLMSFQQVRNECSLVKNKLESLLTLERQILAAGGSIPTWES
uniref:Histidine-containing phosphotransfer protein n=1 Tax=Anthurium amnicola TaxID=1678845 RepID=A0A1D1YEW3_9ARAE